MIFSKSLTSAKLTNQEYYDTALKFTYFYYDLVCAPLLKVPVAFGHLINLMYRYQGDDILEEDLLFAFKKNSFYLNPSSDINLQRDFYTALNFAVGDYDIDFDGDKYNKAEFNKIKKIWQQIFKSVGYKLPKDIDTIDYDEYYAEEFVDKYVMEFFKCLSKQFTNATGIKVEVYHLREQIHFSFNI